MGGTGGGGAGLFNNGQLPVADTTITGNVTGNGGTGGSGARPGGGGAGGGIFQVDGGDCAGVHRRGELGGNGRQR